MQIHQYDINWIDESFPHSCKNFQELYSEMSRCRDIRHKPCYIPIEQKVVILVNKNNHGFNYT